MATDKTDVPKPRVPSPSNFPVVRNEKGQVFTVSKTYYEKYQHMLTLV